MARAGRQSIRAGLVTVVVLAALGAVPARPLGTTAAAQSAGPTITVDPSVDLVDAQAVNVSGSAFPVGEVSIHMCPATAASPADCDPAATWTYAATGDFETTLRVRALLRLPDGDLDCRTPDACVIRAASENGGGEPSAFATAPVHFDPDGPLAAPPTASITPAEGLVDGQLVTVTGLGFVRSEWILVLQCQAPAASWADCDQETAQYGWASEGSFELEIPARAILDTPGHGGVDCRQAGTCVILAAYDLGDQATDTDRAVVPLSFDPNGPLQPGPTLTVDPPADLLDGQTVDLAGGGFAELTSLRLWQCTPEPQPTAETCRSYRDLWIDTDETGSFALSVPVSARVTDRRPPEPQVVDCRTTVEPCRLVVTAGEPSSPRAGLADLHFDPDGVLLPHPAITVAPATGLHDFQDLTIEGTDFVPGSQVEVAVCAVSDPQSCDQDNAERPTPGDDGALTTRIAGWSFVRDWSTGERVDCRVAPGCVVTATETARGLVATAPLEFGPPDPHRGRYRDPVFDQVQVDGDVVYRQTTDHHGNPVTLALDIYRPVGDTATVRPAIVWMHGGFFVGGDKSAMAAYAEAFARLGYVGVSLQYRLRPDLDPSDLVGSAAAAVDAFHDANAGVTWLQDHAEEYGIDPRAIATGGFSAGAVTAFNQAYLPRQLEGGPTESVVAAALPIAGLNLGRPDPGEPPSIIFHSTHDTVLPFNNGHEVCPVAQPVGIACELVAYDGANHSSRLQDTVRRGADFLAVNVLAPLGYFDRPECTIIGTEGDDHLVGTSGDDVICGLGGDDVVKAKAGHDVAYGGEGDDRLFGEAGGDLLIGEAGDDRAFGGRGVDECEAEHRVSCQRPR